MTTDKPMTMVERVARGIFEAQPRTMKIKWDELPEGYHEMWLAQARAALEAMRKPTPKMIEAGVDALFRCRRAYNIFEEDWVEAAYRDAIDTALKE